jgi:hypothetical protein
MTQQQIVETDQINCRILGQRILKLLGVTAGQVQISLLKNGSVLVEREDST